MSHFITFGEYVLLDKLGEGGVAEVWRACKREDLFRDRPNLALKRILSGCGEEEHKLFTAEASLASALVHPNLVQIHSFGEVEGRLFLEMELVEGTSVAGLMMAQEQGLPALPIELAAYIAHEVAQGLSHAHSKGLIHRDVSPQNVLLSIKGEVKLTDFGVAVARGLRERGKPLGKPGYMPPEQLAGGPALPRWDVFALGVLLWEMLTGKRLFHNIPPEEIAQNTRQGLPRPSAYRPEVPAALDAVCARALAARPEERYPNAEGFCADLKAAFGDREEAARRLGELIHEQFPPCCAVPPESRGTSDSHGHLIALDPELLPSATETTAPSTSLSDLSPAPSPSNPPVISEDLAPLAMAETPAMGMVIPPPKNAPLFGLGLSQEPLPPPQDGPIQAQDGALRLTLPNPPLQAEPELRPIRIEPPAEDEEEEGARPMFDAPTTPPHWPLWIGALLMLAFVIGSAVWALVR